MKFDKLRIADYLIMKMIENLTSTGIDYDKTYYPQPSISTEEYLFRFHIKLFY